MTNLNRNQRALMAAAWSLHRQNALEFTGFELAKEDRRLRRRRLMMAYGTMYRALDQLVERRLLARRKEDEAVATAENRPRRTFYRLTDTGKDAAYAAAQQEAEKQRAKQPAAAVPATAFADQR